MTWTIRRLSGFCGAELTGARLEGAPDAVLDAARDALFTYGVVTFPDQHLSPEGHLALARHLGEIDVNRFFTPVDGYPEIAEVRTAPDATGVIGGSWHSDHSYDAAPAMASVLNARELPPYGGDTHFASQVAALNALSPGLRSMLAGQKAEHSDASFADSKLGLGGDADAFRGSVKHPVIIRHPQTGVSALYVNGDFTMRFDGWSAAESAPLLNWLYAHCAQPVFCCRVSWKPGMVAIWDNRLVQHYATADYAGHARLMHRVTVAGQVLEAGE